MSHDLAQSTMSYSKIKGPSFYGDRAMFVTPSQIFLLFFTWNKKHYFFFGHEKSVSLSSNFTKISSLQTATSDYLFLAFFFYEIWQKKFFFRKET